VTTVQQKTGKQKFKVFGNNPVNSLIQITKNHVFEAAVSPFCCIPGNSAISQGQ
jgi:hypothetical protein